MNLNALALLSRPQNENNDQQWLQLTALVDQLNPEQKLWLSGYLAATAQSANNLTPQLAAQPTSTSVLTVLYGSQTGNGEGVAKQLKEQAESAGLTAELLSLADITVKQLAKKTHVAMVVSTHGEGEAPDDAEVFYEQLFSSKAPELPNLKYSVLALGDSSYELYCQTGKEIDQRLGELGATRLLERIDCDVDYEEPATQWATDVVPKFATELKSDSNDNITTLPINSASNSTTVTKQNPFPAEILTIQKITGRGSAKNTYHIELEIDPELVQYQPGDSLGIWAQNDQDTVNQLLRFWQLNGDEVHSFKGQEGTITTLLTEQVELTQISKPFIQYLAEHIDDAELQHLASSHQAFVDYCQTRQLLDLLQEFDPEHTMAVADVLTQLKSITPRLYSIASSQSIFDDEVHLTINLEEPTDNDKYGLASGLLCRSTQAGDHVSVYVEPNNHFRLPADTETDIIMVGPGTGVAPFRAFLQQRQQQKATGHNWLIFGNPHFNTDFLYQLEWLKHMKAGVLNQLDVAFSRDQEHKVYVQHKLQAEADLVWQKLQSGAHIYVCGDANQMAKDVESTLLNIISNKGGLSENEAKDYLKSLKRNNRYQKDVY